MTWRSSLQRGDIADVGARLLSGLSGTRHRVIHHYETVPFIALELGPDALILLGQLAGMVSEIHHEEEGRWIAQGARRWSRWLPS